MNIEIAKVAIKGGRIGLFVTEINGDVEAKKELKDDTRLPHPDLLDKAEAFKFHLIRSISRETLGDYGKEKIARDYVEEFNRTEVSGVSQKNNSLVITGSQKSWGGSKNKFTVPIPIGDSSPYRFVDEIINDWEGLKEEAESFYLGEKYHTEHDPSSQQSIFGDEEAEKGGFSDGMEAEKQFLT